MRDTIELGVGDDAAERGQFLGDNQRDSAPLQTNTARKRGARGGAIILMNAKKEMPHPADEIGRSDASGCGGQAECGIQEDYATTAKIAPAAKPARRKGARALMEASSGLPSSANHSGASGCLNARNCMPQTPSPSQAEATNDRADALFGAKNLLPDQLCLELMGSQKERRFCIKSQSRCDRSAEAFMARQLGYTADQDEKTRAALWKRVLAARKAIEGGQMVDGFSLGAVSVVLHSAKSREIWDGHRKVVEKRMEDIAKQLPAHDWVLSIKGFGAKGLAIIIGETGDLSNYATKERVWKRLGLAVIGGIRQQKRSNVEEAAIHGYNPARRAEVWSIIDSMFRHQVAGDKDENGDDPKKSKLPVAVAAHPTGPYGRVYYRRREHTADREWSDMRRMNDAKRVMTKALLEDLWRVWNGKEPLCV